MKKLFGVLLVLLMVSPLAADSFGIQISVGPMTEIIPQYLNGTIQDIDDRIGGLLKSGTFPVDMGRIDSGLNVNYTYFMDFRKAVIEHGDEAKKPVFLSIIDKDGKEVATWKLIKCWPSKIAASTKDEKGELEFSFDSSERIK